MTTAVRLITARRMGWLNKALLAVNLALFAALLLLMDAQGAALLKPGDFEYKDLVSVMLTTVGVILTFIGIIVAVAAIWGYQSIRGLAEKKAEETAKAGCSTHLQSSDFRENVDTIIRERMENVAQTLVQNALAAVQQEQQQQQQQQQQQEQGQQDQGQEEQQQQPEPEPQAQPEGAAEGVAGDGDEPANGDEPWRD